MKVRVGVLLPLSGQLSQLVGTHCREAVSLACELALRGAPVDPSASPEVRFGDANDPREAEQEARRLITEEGVALLVGTVVTPHSLPASAEAARHGVPYMEVAAAGDEVTERNLPDIFRFSLRGSAYGTGVVDFAAARLATVWHKEPANLRVGVVYQDSVFGRSVADGAIKQADRAGLSVVIRRPVADDEEVDTIMRDLRDYPLDLLFQVQLGNRMAPLWRALRETGAPVRTMVGNAGWGYLHNIEAAGQSVEGTLVAGTPSLGTFPTLHLAPYARQDQAAWMARCGDLGSLHALTAPVDRDLFFSGTLALFRHLTHARGREGNGIARILRAIDLPMGSTPVAFGVRFDRRGENERAFLAISQWQNGRRVTIWPDAVAGGELRTDLIPSPA